MLSNANVLKINWVKINFSKMRYFLLLLLFLENRSQAFVLLSGPEKATLPVSLESPTVSFIWNGDSPFISNKSEIAGGAYASSTDGEVMAYLLQQSLNRWSTVRGSFLKLDLGPINSSISIDAEDGINAIVVGKQSSISTAASARPFYENGIIKDCDIEVGTNAISAKSLEITISHELGHCVGLGHAHSNYGAIMGYSRPQTSPNLGADDKAGVIFLYPDPAYGSQKLETLSCGHVRGLSQPSVIMLLLAFPAILQIRRQKRARS